MTKNIIAPEPYLKPFPAFDDVFAEPQHFHRKHFLPLISADASVVYPDLDFWLHFVTPIEPLLELDVGYFTKEFHDFYNIEGQYAFNFADGKYTFSGDFRYFAYESGAIFRAFPNQEDEIHADYQSRISSYEESRRGFLKYARIPWCADSPYDPDRRSCGPLVSQLGGDPVLVNWDGPAVPVNRSGKLFRYIGEVQGFSYCAGGIQAILLFYDPEEQIALFRTEWT